MPCAPRPAKKRDRTLIVARDNAHYGITDRCYVTNVSKATVLDADKLAVITASA